MRKLLLAAALAALAAPALAQPIEELPHAAPPARPEHAFRRLFLSPAGEPFRGPDGLGAWFAQADADHDGAVTRPEFQADAERAFARYDANKDGVIDAFEVQAYERDIVPELGEPALPGLERAGGERGGGRRFGRPRRGGAGRGEAAARGPRSLLNEPEPLLAADEDVDGRVSRQEWAHATDRRFGRLDKDGAGRLTLDKLRPGRGDKGASDAQ